MEIQKINIKSIKPNSGQIDGVPKNPRKWTKEDVAKLAASIQETPELMEARPCIVYRHNGEYVVIGGNMRLEALKALKRKDVPCFVFENLPTETIKAMVMKDNSSFGEWDVDELANGIWSDYDLEGWGIRNIAGVDADDFSGKNQEIDTDAFSEDMALKFKFHADEWEFFAEYMKGKDPRIEILKLVGYGE